jgi:hypothetical protein
MNTDLSNALYGISYLINLLVLIGLWWVTLKAPEARRLWGLLALAGTLGFIADLAWGLIFMLAPDIWLDWIDYLYIARYLLVFLAFLIFPQLWGWRTWLGVLGSTLVGWLLVWLLLARPAQNPDPSYIWAGMVFPVLDVGILFAAVYRWRTSESALQPTWMWLSLAMLSYGAANWFNYSVRVTNPEADSLPALILWPLSTIFMAVAIWQFIKRK